MSANFSEYSVVLCMWVVCERFWRSIGNNFWSIFHWLTKTEQKRQTHSYRGISGLAIMISSANTFKCGKYFHLFFFRIYWSAVFQNLYFDWQAEIEHFIAEFFIWHEIIKEPINLAPVQGAGCPFHSPLSWSILSLPLHLITPLACFAGFSYFIYNN